MIGSKTIQEIQAEYENIKKAMAALAAKQVKLQQQLVTLNLLKQFKQHGLIQSKPTWYAAGVGFKFN